MDSFKDGGPLMVDEGPVDLGIREHFGRMLRKARSQTGQTMFSLAVALGLAVVQVSDIERGNVPPPRWTLRGVQKLAGIMGLPMQVIIDATIESRRAFGLHGSVPATPVSKDGPVPVAAVDGLDALAHKIRAWQHLTFPAATLASTFAHLRREIEEVAKDPSDGEELADLFHLLVAVADHAGVDLATEVSRKFEKNLARKWKAPDHEGVVEHVREPA